MKPEPYIPPLPRALTADERLLIEVSAAGGRANPVGLVGASNFATARRLVKLGLGWIDGRKFTANTAGMAAVAER